MARIGKKSSHAVRSGRSRYGSGNAPRYINRELSWLAFNLRVLHEGMNACNPLLERLAFLSIVSSNLDEFFMVRVGGLRQLVDAGLNTPCSAGMTPEEQLTEIARRVHEMVGQQYRCLGDELLPALAREGIRILRTEELSDNAQRVVDHYFEDEILPSFTPVAVADKSHFPEIDGLALHLVVHLRKKSGRAASSQLALVPLPRSWPRFFPVPPGRCCVLLEDIVRRHLTRFFPGYAVLDTAVFRVTRNTDQAVDDEEAEDLLAAMEDLVRARKDGSPVRLELERNASPELGGFLCRALRLNNQRDLYRVDGPLDLKPFSGLAANVSEESLHYPPFAPRPVAAFVRGRSVWDVIRERDVLAHLPYESFAPVVQVLQEAADDPDVIAIKQTLYRTSSESPVIAALERAARRGKQVTVLVELKARFDEAQNMNWAKRLAEGGVHVVWGVTGLKTHAKLLMIVRREAESTRRYVHLSTGNYHEQTAKRYEDVGLFTCQPDIGADAANFFNAVTGYSEMQEWRQFVVAPVGMRARLHALIDREIARAAAGDHGQIMLKMNSLADTELSLHLHRAAEQGVKVSLCIRGVCCLRPGRGEASANLQVVSLVDRFLEHSRIFYFRNGGTEEVYLSSADLMPRNLDRRIELMCPVLDQKNAQRLIAILQSVMHDNQRAWRLKADGTYQRVVEPNQPQHRAQEIFIKEATENHRASRLRQAYRPHGPGVAPGMRREHL